MDKYVQDLKVQAGMYQIAVAERLGPPGLMIRVGFALGTG